MGASHQFVDLQQMIGRTMWNVIFYSVALKILLRIFKEKHLCPTFNAGLIKIALHTHTLNIYNNLMVSKVGIDNLLKNLFF